MFVISVYSNMILVSRDRLSHMAFTVCSPTSDHYRHASLCKMHCRVLCTDINFTKVFKTSPVFPVTTHGFNRHIIEHFVYAHEAHGNIKLLKFNAACSLTVTLRNFKVKVKVTSDKSAMKYIYLPCIVEKAVQRYRMLKYIFTNQTNLAIFPTV